MCPDTIVAGAWAGPQLRSAAYLFTRLRTLTGGLTWVETGKLTPPDGQPGDGFGSDVALTGAIVIVGAAHQSLTRKRFQERLIAPNELEFKRTEQTVEALCRKRSPTHFTGKLHVDSAPKGCEHSGYQPSAICGH
jgi:hypothetical protein